MSCKEVLHQATGSIAIVASGIFINGNTVLSRLFTDAGWPYFRLMGTAALCIAGGIMMVKVSCDGWDGLSCKQNEIKWVIGRGLCGTLQFLFAVLAAVAGAGLGDIGALSSINTVVAALLGRCVLGERIGPVHVLAMLLSITGAVFISDPTKMNSGSKPFAWLGYTLALLCGASLGLMFICARKSKSASSWLMTVSAMGQRGLVFWIVAGTPAVDDFSYDKVVASPWLAVCYLLLLTFTTFTGNFLATVGAKRCPAAISATLMTAVSMGVGYGAQIAIFKQMPNSFTLVGALLMLLAVVTMAFARLPKAQTEPSIAPSVQSSRSLASFVASEYAVRQGSESEMVPAVSSELRPRAVSLGSHSHA